MADVKWFCYLLRELRINLPTPPFVLCDNISTLHLAHNPMFHGRTRHIEIDYHFIREIIARGATKAKHVSSEDQLADVFTKPLPKERFKALCNKLNLHEIPLSLMGTVGIT